ncbi:MAG: helix-turn-helix domain-containing protein [Oscillospiraceae bacterium]|nr:helix-turn-helix domain-containing protein [Oscillospiraceae bacterium]
MPKLKKKITRDFTTIHNTMLRDMRLGATERGLLLTMLSLPDNWNYSIKGLSCILPDGATKIGTALKNLAKTGYLVRRRVYSDGKITDWEYTFSDEPMTDVENLPQESEILDLENLDSENLNQGILDQENHDDNKRNNNQISNNQISSDQASIHQSDGLTIREQYTELVKTNIEYVEYAEWIRLFAGDYMTVQELDEIVSIIVNAITTEKKSDRICGQEYPREVIRSVMLKVDRGCVERTIEIMKHTGHIRNYERYLLSTLFNEANGKHLKSGTENRQIDEQLRQEQPVYDLTGIFT